MGLDVRHMDEKTFQKNFEDIYLSYHSGMVRFAQEYVSSKEDAENIIHDAFTEIWEMRKGYIYKANYLLAILFTSIKNKCIDYLRHKTVIRESESIIQEEYRLSMQMKFHSLEAFNQDILLSEENTVEGIISKALDSLPEKCREIFIKSKLEGKKQKEIAKELNISINTVETQMGIAYKKLKQELKNYLPLLLFLFHL